MNLNLDHLKYLVSAIRLSSYAEAARELNISSRGISKAVKQLERTFGMALFTRSGSAIAPTELACVIEPQINAILARVDDLEFLVNSVRTAEGINRPLSLGVAASPLRCRTFDPQDFEPLLLKNPRCRLDIRFNGNELCASALKEGLLDAAIVFGTIDKQGIECRSIGTLAIRIAVAQDHPLARKARLNLHDLDERPVAAPLDERCVFPKLARCCRNHTVAPYFVKPEADPAALRRFIEQGGLVVVGGEGPSWTAETGVAVLPFDGEEFSIPLNFAFKSDDKGCTAPLYAHLLRLANRERKGAFDRPAPFKNATAATSNPSIRRR